MILYRTRMVTDDGESNLYQYFQVPKGSPRIEVWRVAVFVTAQENLIGGGPPPTCGRIELQMVCDLESCHKESNQ